MSFFCVYTPKRKPALTLQIIFGRSTYSNTGWLLCHSAGGNMEMGMGNTVPNLVRTSTAFVPGAVGMPQIAICSYVSGTARSWINGVAATPVSVGVGATSEAVATAIGGSPVLGNYIARDFIIHEAGMLDNYDCAATIATLNAQWTEDLRQGRALTWPRVAVPGSDWLWSARDANLGLGGCVPSWIDRYSGVIMTQAGSVQSASVPGRIV